MWRTESGAKPRWIREAWIVGSRVSLIPPDDPPDDVVEGVAVPGLVDVHCHLGYDSSGVTSRERTIRDAAAVARSGVLLVRDAGIPERANDCLIGRDDAPGLIRCGRHLARPKRYIRGLGFDLADADDLAAAMAAQARASDGWVKIVGDWIDRAGADKADLAPLWSLAQLRDGVRAAHDHGARVAVHTFSHAAIDDLLEAGVDDIEHGSGLDATQARACAERGIPVTPTLLQISLFDQFAAAAGTKYPIYRDTMRAMWNERVDHFRMLLDCGVHLLPGTDSGGYQDHGSLPRELVLWREWGAADRDILAWATWRARDFLGADVLSEGAPADVVVYPSSPEDDIAVVAHPAAVWRRGRRLV
nr:amidohydrolase family protein [Nanchangia anserum]